MIKKIKKFLIGAFSVFLVAGLNLTAYAAEENFSLKAQAIENVETFVNENAARATGNARGMLISTVELSIEDLGSGTAKLFGQVLCHEQMKKIKLNLILDKWIPEDNDWSQVNRFEYTWLAEEEPDQELTMAYTYVEVPNLERGQNYRVRGIAGAWDYDSSYYEVWSEKTPSILVE